MCQPLIHWMVDLNMKAKSIRRRKKNLHDHELSKVFAERILKIMTEEQLEKGFIKTKILLIVWIYHILFFF